MLQLPPTSSPVMLVTMSEQWLLVSSAVRSLFLLLLPSLKAKTIYSILLNFHLCQFIFLFFPTHMTSADGDMIAYDSDIFGLDKKSGHIRCTTGDTFHETFYRLVTTLTAVVAITISTFLFFYSHIQVTD